MNLWVTKDQISSEYDGLVWTKGAAAIIGVSHFTIGLTAGWDNLLNKNNKYWIYESKLWIGTVFGLNLN